MTYLILDMEYQETSFEFNITYFFQTFENFLNIKVYQNTHKNQCQLSSLSKKLFE